MSPQSVGAPLVLIGAEDAPGDRLVVTISGRPEGPPGTFVTWPDRSERAARDFWGSVEPQPDVVAALTRAQAIARQHGITQVAVQLRNGAQWDTAWGDPPASGAGVP